ncbi:MAG: 50S ribosomal protein L25 [Candidatus Margulisiibacteriota bacterium]
MKKISIEAKARDLKANVVRNTGMIPAVVYGKGMSSVSVAVDNRSFMALLRGSAGKNALITLNVEEKGVKTSFPVLAHDMQTDAISDKVIHIDFLKVDLEQEIRTKVPVVVIGEAEGVKLDGGILVQAIRQVEVKCLPTNIPDKIEVDCSPLKIGNSIHVSNLTPPKGVVITSFGEDVVVMVSAPAKEEVVAPVAEAAAVVGEVPAGEAGVVPTAGAAPVAGAAAAPEASKTDAKAAKVDPKAKVAPKQGK